MSLFFGRGEEKRGMDWWGAGFDSPPGNRIVTPETATYLAPVFAAIRHIVDYATTTPIDYYREKADNTTEPAPIPALFRTQDNPGKAGLGQWIGQAVFGMVTTGNTVGWIVDVDAYGNPTDVIWLKHSDWDYDYVSKMWVVKGEHVPSSQVVHIPWIVPTGGVLGMSPIEHYKSIVSAGLSAQDYADVKRGGGIPPAILKNNAMVLTPEQADTMKRRATASFAKGDPFVTGADWDYSTVTIPPNQAQFIETLKMSATTIASIYGLEPREVGGVAEGSSELKYVNDESLELNRAGNVRPYLIRLEQAFSRLMPLRQQFRFDMDAKIRTDTKTRWEIYALQQEMGVMSVNDIARAEKRPPIPGGDYYKVPKPTPDPTAAEPPPPAVPIPTLPK